MQKFLLLILLLISGLYAKNPIVYAALGDTIYNNAQKIEKLKSIDVYKSKIKDIDEYLLNVRQTKKEGFALEKNNANISKKRYLQKLRRLSSINDFYMRSIDKNFRLSMKHNDYKLFTKMINENLLDESYKNDILDFYFDNSDKIKATGRLKQYIDENQKLMDRKNSKRTYLEMKRAREKAKIDRIRQADKEAQKMLEERLEDEANRKKDEIIKEQQRELL